MTEPKIVCIVGLSGSGKTNFINKNFKDFKPFDDIGDGCCENGDINKVLSEIDNGKSVVVSDVEFCRSDFRQRFEACIGRTVEWVCFENKPWECAVNCLHRFLTEANANPHEKIKKMERFFGDLEKIKKLSPVYQPFGVIESVTQMEMKEWNGWQ